MTAALATAGLRKIRVYGTLARLIGRREMRATVSTVPEAMRFLLANFPQIEGHLKGRFFKVKVANWSLTEHDLEAPVGQTETIHIIPAICGAGGDGPLVGILAGAALLGIGLLVPFGSSVLVPLGMGLLLNGVAALLSPTPGVPDDDNDPARSYNFSGIQQNSREGIPVPLVYGDIVTGSVVLSVNIDEDEEELAGGADALFEGGTGNPNPDPNPVPDPPSDEPSFAEILLDDMQDEYPGICFDLAIELYIAWEPACEGQLFGSAVQSASSFFGPYPFRTLTHLGISFYYGTTCNGYPGVQIAFTIGTNCDGDTVNFSGLKTFQQAYFQSGGQSISVPQSWVPLGCRLWRKPTGYWQSQYPNASIQLVFEDISAAAPVDYELPATSSLGYPI